MKQILKITGAATLTAATITIIVLNRAEPSGSTRDGRKSNQSTRAALKGDSRVLSKSYQSRPRVNQVSGPAADAAGLASGGEEAVEEILNSLSKAKSLKEQLVYADALALVGSERAIEGLYQHAKTLKNLDERARLLSALQALSNPQALPALTEAVITPADSRSLQASIDALARLANAEALDDLVGRYRTDPQVKLGRGKIGQAIARIENPDLARSLASLARTAPEPGLVEAAARALSKIGTTTAAQGLADIQERIGESDPVLRASVAELIRRVENPEGRRLLASLQSETPE